MVLIGLLLFFLLLIWLQRTLYDRYWGEKLNVTLQFSEKTGVEGGKVELKEQITSRKPLPLPWLTVKFQVSRYLRFPDNLHASISDDYYREDLFSIGMYQRISRTLPVVLDKRGYYTIKSIDLISSDLLLTSKLVGHAQSDTHLTVCPRLIAREELSIPFQQLIGEVLSQRSLIPDPFEFRTIREYQSFDTLRSINWLATARTGDLKVNVHEVTASREVLILLNVEPDAAFYEEKLIEEGIRVAASMAQYLTDDGISCALMTNARDVITGKTVDLSAGRSVQHAQHIQEQLGRLDLQKESASFADMLEQKLSQIPKEPILLFVSLNCNHDLCRIWDEGLDSGFDGLWILPRYQDRKDRVPDIRGDYYCWEVNRYAH